MAGTEKSLRCTTLPLCPLQQLRAAHLEEACLGAYVTLPDLLRPVCIPTTLANCVSAPRKQSHGYCSPHNTSNLTSANASEGLISIDTYTELLNMRH
eukprot:1156252-Pelagomonas_calceolata.AAC.5